MTGFCPIESAAIDCGDLNERLKLIKVKLEELAN